MVDRTIMIENAALDQHEQLASADRAVNGSGVPFALQGDLTGVIGAYATMAAAIADTANLVNGQLVLIAGGDSQTTGFPNADQGVWKVDTNKGAAYADYSKKLDVADKASEIFILDTAGFYTSTSVEAALAEIGTKQVFFKLGGLASQSVTGATSTAFDAALTALVLDNGTATDTDGLGSSTVPGIILNAAYAYQIPIRSGSTRNVIDDGSGNEVYARLSCPAGVYTLTFYSFVAGVETAYTFGSATSIDIGYVLVSQDFMKLPAYAGVVQGEFFGDQAGAVGNVSDTQVTTTGPFTGLLAGLTTQSAVNIQVDKLGLTTVGMGASLIAIADAAGSLAATNVETAIAELVTMLNGKVRNFANQAAAIVAAGVTAFKLGDYVILTGAGADAAERGIWKITSGNGANAGDYTKVLDITHTASELLVADAGNYWTGLQLEAVLDELAAALGGTSSTVRNYSSNTVVTDNDSLVTAIGKLDAAIGAVAQDKITSMAFTAGEAIAAATNGPQLVSADGTAWKVLKTVAGSVGPKPEVIGFATGADYATNAAIVTGNGVVMGGLCSGFTGLTPGARYYASPTTAGQITNTIPNVVGQWVIPVGIAVSATVLDVVLGDPQEIVPAQKALQVAVHFKDTSGAATGLGATGYAVAVGDIWVDNDASVQNPTKSGVARYTVYVCKVAWTGTGAAMTSGNVNTNFQPIGKQG